jgi:hypothetical protein
MARFCAEILATGSKCSQFARTGQPWCRVHSNSNLREKNADTRQLIAMIADMGLFSVANMLGKIVYEFREKLISPLHAQLLLDATAARLEELSETLGQEMEESAYVAQAAQAFPDNLHGNNRLQVVSIK